MVAALAATIVVVAAPSASAHPRLLSAVPKPSTTVTGAPAQVVVRFDEGVRWEYSEIGVDDIHGHSVVEGKPRLSGREAVVPLVSGVSGAMRVHWRLVGLDAHPVTGAFVFGVRAGGAMPDTTADLQAVIRNMAGTLGEGRVGSSALNWAIRGGRSVEIILLYLVLGIVLVRVLVLSGRPTFARGGPAAATIGPFPAIRNKEPDKVYRTMRAIGMVAVIATPVLFALYVARLESAVPGVSVASIVFSSLGETWTLKAFLWLSIVAAGSYGLRRFPHGSHQHDLLLLSLASAAAIAFGYNTHANGLSPTLLWTLMMWGHLVVTAFWAGGLVALLLLVFPTGDPDVIWGALGRFSTLMGWTIGIVVVSGLIMLFRLLAGNVKGMWCSDFGVVAGFKMAVVGIAIAIGAVNNRLVAFHKQARNASINPFRPPRAKSIGFLRRLIIAEAVVLGSAIVLSGALGETQLPSVFKGNFFPVDLQETVRPGLFGSGCH